MSFWTKLCRKILLVLDIAAVSQLVPVRLPVARKYICNHLCLNVAQTPCSINILLPQRTDFKGVRQFSITLQCGAVVGSRKKPPRRNNDLHPADLHVWQMRQWDSSEMKEMDNNKLVMASIMVPTHPMLNTGPFIACPRAPLHPLSRRYRNHFCIVYCITSSTPSSFF